MSTGEEMWNQRREEVDGREITRDLTDHKRERLRGRDMETKTHSLPIKLRDSSTMSGAGKTDNSKNNKQKTLFWMHRQPSC